MSDSSATVTAILAEKPSVARDIARVLGAAKKGDGFLHGNGYVVTWAVGHLVSLAQPHEMRPEWKQWRLDLLPMLPGDWPLVVYEKTKAQFEVVRKILNSPRVAQVVCATDAGREGELIFRYIYGAALCDKPVNRLWISSMTADAIRKGFEKLQPGSAYDGLADAAHGRSRADWLVGMNLSRAYSLIYNEEISVGRVQTPTLAMVVERELTLRQFVSEEYIEVIAKFEGLAERKKETYAGTWFRPRGDQGNEKETQAKLSRLAADGEEAKLIVERARTGTVTIESVKSETQRAQPPLLYDLTELQRHANRLFGFTAQETLTYAQALYERHKLISYPRTDSRHLSSDVVATVGQIANVVAPQYPQMVAEGTGTRTLSKRYVDDSKVSDHHAILPNAVNPGKLSLSPQERRIYDMVCRRFLMMWHEDHLQAVTTVITAITNPGQDGTESVVDRYRTSGTLVQQMGWKVLDPVPEKRKKGGKDSEEEEAAQVLPTDLAEGQPQRVAAIDAKKKKTKPPKRFTEGTLLTAMQTAGQSLDEKELSEAMKDTGLGTPATRASIIETLLKRGYIVRSGKTLEATDKGIHLIDVVHPEVKTPAMTGQWEAYLKKINQGEAHLAPFIEGINAYVSGVMEKVRVTPRRRFASTAKTPQPASDKKAAGARPQTTTESKAKKPSKTTQLNVLLKERFDHKTFLPGQKAACLAALSGKDHLLALPDGKGKTLCYQLAGLALEGTSLVASARVEWMEAEAAKLRERGIACDCIHANRSREALRAACVDYLSGRLKFLYVAPERLSVAGFPQMLAKRAPALIAIEEAERAVRSSQDYLANYELLREHLPALRPAVLLALTREQTPAVHTAIAEFFGLSL
ncbi:DNA topoisomerase III [Terriglobus albidus]|uniref:DNA topoisomerase n=1 Tax=Terriglobus albidus TaxID=1592106 RepID=A0A5B9ECS3_9BACT|nr:DNA topoisomerase 3 [Terriglobus albidus]QEE28955.1 DNA topoisomerase III [Terriglobus albidus]